MGIKLFFYRICCANLLSNEQNPCSSHEIHMLFEHGFQLEKANTEPWIVLHDVTGENTAAFTNHLVNVL